jgi:hypothetical protein
MTVRALAAHISAIVLGRSMSFHGQLLPGPFPIVWLCEGLELVQRCDTLAGWYGRLPCSCGHLLRRCGVGRCELRRARRDPDWVCCPRSCSQIEKTSLLTQGLLLVRPLPLLLPLLSSGTSRTNTIHLPEWICERYVCIMCSLLLCMKAMLNILTSKTLAELYRPW